MGRRVLLAAALLAAVTVPATGAAAATVRLVDQQTGPFTTITDALLAATPGDTIDIHEGHYDEELWVDKDDLTLRASPGTIITQTSPFVVSLMGARDTLEGLTIAGGPGGVRIEGDGARLMRTTVLADTTAVSVKGGITTTLVRSFLRATGLSATALLARNDTPVAQSTTLATSIVVGGRLGTAMDVLTGAVGDTTPTGGAAIDLVFATVTGAPTALRTGRDGQGGAVTVNAYNSIVHGATPGPLPGTSTDTTTPDAGTFVNAPALDFHLRADFPGLDHAQRQPLSLGAEEDFEGRPRWVGSASDQGAFEYLNGPPTATLTGPASVKQNQAFTLDASGSFDPDPGGRIVTYAWELQDGRSLVTATPTLTTKLPGIGTRTVTVQVIDQQGAQATSAPLTLTVTDAVAPEIEMTSPDEGARLHRLRTVKRTGKRRKVINALRFGGRATDAVGVTRVDVTLAQRRTKKVRRPITLTGQATIKGETWRWRTPAKKALPAGSYALTARATDAAGNVSGPGVLHFTVT
jgi:hypothetical protein